MPDTQQELAILKSRINALAKMEHIPAQLLDIVGHVYTQQLNARDRAVLPAITAECDDERNAQGVPLLSRESFPVDMALAKELFENFAEKLIEVGGAAGEAAASILKDIEDKKMSLEELKTAFLNSDEEYFSGWGQKNEQAPRTLHFLTQAALTPSIEAAAKLLADEKKLNSNWPHSHCPICAGLPLIADLKEKEGNRFLTCSFCHSSYRVPRLQCPFCQENDFEKMGYFQSKELPGFRVDVCKGCNKYIKTSDFRQMDRKSLPLLDDLESLPLDIQARKNGYTRATLSAWGF